MIILELIVVFWTWLVFFLIATYLSFQVPSGQFNTTGTINSTIMLFKIAEELKFYFIKMRTLIESGVYSQAGYNKMHTESQL